MQKVPCNKCAGSGETDLPKPLQDTLAAIRKAPSGGITLTELHEALNRRGEIAMTSVFKRLHDLEEFKLVSKNPENKRYTAAPAMWQSLIPQKP